MRTPRCSRTWRPPKVDLDWLSTEIEKLADVRRVCNDAYNRHEHGVIYALRMAAEELDGMYRHPSMGIKSTKPISASKIIAKVIVPTDHSWDPVSAHKHFSPVNYGLLTALPLDPPFTGRPN